MMGLKLAVVLPILALMLLLLWRRAGALSWAVTWIVALWVGFKFGFDTPIPASVIKLYMGITLLSVAAYVTSTRERQAEFLAPIVKLVMRPERRVLLAGIVLLAPMLVALNVYMKMNVPLEAPAFGRTIHPAPPPVVTVHHKTERWNDGHRAVGDKRSIAPWLFTQQAERNETHRPIQ